MHSRFYLHDSTSRRTGARVESCALRDAASLSGPIPNVVEGVF
jgi:hypothetical protein